MQGILKLIKDFPGFEEIKSAVLQKEPLLLSGLSDPFQDYVVSALSEHTGRMLVILTANEVSARNVLDNMSYLMPGSTYFYPAKDPLFYSADMRGDAVEEKRLKTMKAIRERKARVLVMSAEAAFDRILPPEVFKAMMIRRHPGQTLELDTLSMDLVRRGYDRRDQVEHAGQFAIRGGIVDIFPMTSDRAYRIELWDNEIDTIRNLDPETQRSSGINQEIIIDPGREIVADEKTVSRALERIQKEAEEAVHAFRKNGEEESAERLLEVVSSLQYRLGTDHSTTLDAWIPYLYPDSASILDYLPDQTMLVLKDPARIMEKVRTYTQEASQSVSSRMERGYMLPGQAELFPDFSWLQQKMKRFSVVSVCTLLASNQEIIKAKHLLNMASRSVNVLMTMHHEYIEDLKRYAGEGYRVVLLTESALRIPALINELTEAGLPAASLEIDDLPKAGIISLAVGAIPGGFLWPEGKLLLAPQQEGSSREKKRRVRKHFKNGQKIGSFNDLTVGDYVVHETHGVGIYQGIVQIEKDNSSRDYFKISYADGGCLYVPITSLDMLQRYIGGEDARPKVNKLGGQEWNKTKSKVRASVQKLAEELIRVYAVRQSAIGYSFSPDTVWQKEFEDAFPYEETEDQLNAIADTKADMESPRIMDRLICGDVGYGKTEIAIRAAFKAVQDGKQVAMLAPTTILAQQHFNTFTQRMKDYPINIALLSRFRTPSQIRESLRALAGGKVDIIIGTHRLLSKDVHYKNLGLLIVDEEQRFGVTHKDKIKEIQQNVDVLTLTATPIPRTLHMSLSGIRAMSVLEEPPQERQPIQTFVMEEDDELIREAIYRELGRSGQVFFLYNRVRGISEQVVKLQKMVPEARIAFAHGQMSERELEEIMMQFIEGEVDVLVCTTIIETGLDIPNANTIIIADADRMGLAQLYQLRGRVGRSDRLAFAYFTYRKNKVLQEDAQKRLEAIGEFTEFGSGFRIAMRDLQIRGAGNILGAEQHGHMGAVGYELYCKMLKEAMDHLTDHTSAPDFETTMRIDIDAYIPDTYIPVEAHKLEIYKKIALISSEEDYYDLQEELFDRYSEMPQCVGNLLDISMLKMNARRLGIDLVEENAERVQFHFREDAPIDPLLLMNVAKKRPRARLIPKDRTVTLMIPFAGAKKEKDSFRIERLRKIMEELKEIRVKEGETS